MSVKQNKAVLPLVLLVQFMIVFMVTSMFVLVPVIRQTFHMKTDQVRWIEIGYLLTLTAFSIPFGRISDLGGRRKVILSGLIIFGVITFMCTYAYTIQILIILRTMQGLAAAMILSAGNALLIEAYPDHRRGSVLGISASVSFLGMIAGPAVGEYLNNYYSWQSVFLTAAVMAAAAIVICVFGLEPDEIRYRESSIDMRGYILFVPAIAMIMLSLSVLPNIIAMLVFLAIGITVLVLFIHHERCSDDPLIRPGLLTDRIFVLLNSSMLLYYTACCTLICLIGAYLRNTNSAYSEEMTGALKWFCLAAVAAALAAGNLADRRPLNHMGSAAMVSGMISCVMCFFLTKTPSAVFVAVLFLLAGAGSGFFVPVTLRAGFFRVEAPEDGIANAMMNTSYSAGQVMCLVVLSIAFSKRITYISDIKAAGGELLAVIRGAAVLMLVLYGAAAFLSLKREQLERKLPERNLPGRQ